jgi:hypothetical protein
MAPTMTEEVYKCSISETPFGETLMMRRVKDPYRKCSVGETLFSETLMMRRVKDPYRKDSDGLCRR